MKHGHVRGDKAERRRARPTQRTSMEALTQKVWAQIAREAEHELARTMEAAVAPRVPRAD